MWNSRCVLLIASNIRTYLGLNSNHGLFHLLCLINCYAEGFNSFIRVQMGVYVYLENRHQNLYLIWLRALKCKFSKLHKFNSHWIFFVQSRFTFPVVESTITRRHPCQWAYFIYALNHHKFCEILLVDTSEKASEPQMVFLIREVIKTIMPPFLDFLIIISRDGTLLVNPKDNIQCIWFTELGILNSSNLDDVTGWCEHSVNRNLGSMIMRINIGWVIGQHCWYINKHHYTQCTLAPC